MEFLLNWGTWLALLVTAYVAGKIAEKRHLKSIRLREEQYCEIVTCTFAPSGLVIQSVSGRLVYGSVVVSLDYFKRLLAGLRGIFGGRITSYESLLDRARREAMLRMQEAAVLRGFDQVLNVRLETSRIASGRGDGKGTAGVEIIAFGTAVRNKNARQPQIT